MTKKLLFAIFSLVTAASALMAEPVGGERDFVDGIPLLGSMARGQKIPVDSTLSLIHI